MLVTVVSATLSVGIVVNDSISAILFFSLMKLPFILLSKIFIFNLGSFWILLVPGVEYLSTFTCFTETRELVRCVP